MDVLTPRSLFSLPIIVVLLLVGCERQQAVPTANQELPSPVGSEIAIQDPSEDVPVWSLAESATQSLAEPFTMSQFEIRPPSDFRFIKHLAETNTYYWIGPVREDETYAQLFVVITQIPEQKAYDSLDAGINDVLVGVRQRRDDWSNTPTEQGKINGYLFARTSWEGATNSAARKGPRGSQNAWHRVFDYPRRLFNSDHVPGCCARIRGDATTRKTSCVDVSRSAYASELSIALRCSSKPA